MREFSCLKGNIGHFNQIKVSHKFEHFGLFWWRTPGGTQMSGMTHMSIQQKILAGVNPPPSWHCQDFESFWNGLPSLRAGLKVRSCLDIFFSQHACVPPNFTHISFIRPGLQNYIFVSNFVELRYMMWQIWHIWSGLIIRSYYRFSTDDKDQGVVIMSSWTLSTYQPQWQRCWWWHSCFQWTPRGLQSWSDH